MPRRSKIYYARMRAIANETAEEKIHCLSKRRSGDYKNRFEEMKSTRRECKLYYGEKAATK